MVACLLSRETTVYLPDDSLRAAETEEAEMTRKPKVKSLMPRLMLALVDQNGNILSVGEKEAEIIGQAIARGMPGVTRYIFENQGQAIRPVLVCAPPRRKRK